MNRNNADGTELQDSHEGLDTTNATQKRLLGVSAEIPVNRSKADGHGLGVRH